MKNFGKQTDLQDALWGIYC